MVPKRMAATYENRLSATRGIEHLISCKVYDRSHQMRKNDFPSTTDTESVFWQVCPTEDVKIMSITLLIQLGSLEPGSKKADNNSIANRVLSWPGVLPWSFRNRDGKSAKRWPVKIIQPCSARDSCATQTMRSSEDVESPLEKYRDQFSERANNNFVSREHFNRMLGEVPRQGRS